MDDPNFYDEEFLKLKDGIEETFKRICKLKDEIGRDYDRNDYKYQLFRNCLNAFDNHLMTIYNEEESVLFYCYLVID